MVLLSDTKEGREFCTFLLCTPQTYNGCKSVRLVLFRVGNVQVATNVLHIERSESRRYAGVLSV